MGRSVHVLLCVGLGPALRGDAQRASCASMLQTAVGRGLQENASFARELRELYLEQLSFEQTLQRTKRRMVQEPDLPDTNITGEIAAGASSVTDAISARAQSLMNYMNDHTVGKILIYWFGPDAAWSCVPSTVSSGLVCGYFGGWLGMYGICFILTLPVWLIACYFMTYILTDVDDENFDDEEFKKKNGWSLREYQHHVSTLLVTVMFIVELWILWSVDALQTLLKLIEPYAVLALLILTLIFPFALRAYRELRKAGEKLSEAQQVLDNLQEKFFGDMKKVAKRFEVVGETLTGMDLGEPNEPKEGEAADDPAAPRAKKSCC